MKALLSFAAAIAEPQRLRILVLAEGRKVTPSELAGVLKLDSAALARQLKQLTDAGLLKADGEGGCVRVKKKHRAVLGMLFAHYEVSAKKDMTLKSDAQLARQLREARHRAEKAARKAKAVTAPAKKAGNPAKKPKAKTK